MEQANRSSHSRHAHDHLQPVAPPRHLLRRIIDRFGIERKLQALKKRLLTSGAMTTIAGIGLIGAIIILQHELMISEFGPIASLPFSDTDFVITHSHDFGYAFIEAIPLVQIIMLLAAILVVLIGLRLITQYTSTLATLLRSIQKKFN